MLLLSGGCESLAAAAGAAVAAAAGEVVVVVVVVVVVAVVVIIVVVVVVIIIIIGFCHPPDTPMTTLRSHNLATALRFRFESLKPEALKPILEKTLQTPIWKTAF